MKTKIAILLCFTSLFLNAQEIPKLNTGIDFLIIYKNLDNSNGALNYSSKGGVFIEKPFQISLLRQIVLSPGLSFKAINENFNGGGLGAGSTSDLNHYSINGYLKIIRKTDIIKIKPAVLYYGVFGGPHLYTRAKGSKSNYSMFYPEANWENQNYKEEPSHFFKKMYFGFLTGIEFTGNAFIKPSMEVRFLPIIGEYKENVLNPFELAINLAFGTQKLKLKE